MKGIFFQKSDFRCRENIYICRPLRRLRRLAIEYVKNKCLGIISCKTNSSSEICAHLADYRFSVCRPFWISLPYI